MTGVAADVIDRLTLRQQFDGPVDSPGHEFPLGCYIHPSSSARLSECRQGRPGLREPVSPPGDRIGTAGEEDRRQQQMWVK